MDYLINLDEYNFNKPCGVGLGNFDGLHIGHMALINCLITECKINDYNSVVYTFFKHPEHILRKKLFTPLITTIESKRRLLENHSLDYLCVNEFDETFSRISPEDFVKNILIEKLNIKLAVVGFNYKFGYQGKGDSNLLKLLGEKYGFKVIVLPPVKLNNEIVSSTLIRKYINKGNMSKVFELLGRHFSMYGEVIEGKKLGRKIGFPTANIINEGHMVAPKQGVYQTITKIDEVFYKSVTNIGDCPTLKDEKTTTIETHIIDFSKDLYGKTIEVFFIRRIRNQMNFENKYDLIEAIKKDISTHEEN